MAVPTTLADVATRVVGAAHGALLYYENAKIATPAGPLPVFVVLHAVAMAATFRTPRSAPVRYVWAELGCYLLFVLAGQIAFAFLASVPLPILESNAVLPAYLAAWTVCHLSDLVHDLFAWSGLAWIRRAAGVGMAGLGITVFGIDWAAASGPTTAFRTSAVAGLALAILPCIAAVVLNAVLHLAWGAHPASARQPLPYAWTPDYSFRDIHVVVWVAAAYYLLVDPHGYAEDALYAAGFDGRAIYTSVTYLIPSVTARFLVHAALLFAEFYRFDVRVVPSRPAATAVPTQRKQQ